MRKQYYIEHREEIREKSKKYYIKNQNKIKAKVGNIKKIILKKLKVVINYIELKI